MVNFFSALLFMQTEKVTFAVKFMPESSGYMLAYQVGQTAWRDLVTQDGKVCK
jgi:hypothetical protein